jgi:hypothetical protein
MDSTRVESWYLGAGLRPHMGMARDPSEGIPLKKVEYKVTVLGVEEQKVRDEIQRQHASPIDRTVYFYDTAELALCRRSLFLRARVTDGTPDSTLKLRPLPASGIPARWEDTGKVRFERDVVGTRPVLSVKLDHTPATGKIGQEKPRKLFSDAQEKLVVVKWDDVKAYGPIHAQVWTLKFAGFSEKIDVEEWRVDNGPHFIELSFKVDPEQAEAAETGFHDVLDGLGIGHQGNDDPKTRIVLKHFAKLI